MFGSETSGFSSLLGGEPPYPRLRATMLALAYNSVRALFSAKMGYDLWKVRKELEQTESIAAAYETRMKGASTLDESKLNDSSEQEDEQEEEKSQQFDLDEKLKSLQEQQLNALRCCAIAAGFNAWSELIGNTVVEPSAQLLLATLFAAIWNVNPKILLHFYETTCAAIVERVDAAFRPFAGFVSRHAAFRTAHLCKLILRHASVHMNAISLEDLGSQMDECTRMVNDQARKRNFEELKTAAVEREIKFERRKTVQRKAPRQSSVF